MAHLFASDEHAGDGWGQRVHHLTQDGRGQPHGLPVLPLTHQLLQLLHPLHDGHCNTNNNNNNPSLWHATVGTLSDTALKDLEPSPKVSGSLLCLSK